MKSLAAYLSVGFISYGTALLPCSAGYAQWVSGHSIDTLIAQSQSPFICTIQRYSQDGQFDLFDKPAQAQRIIPNGFLPLWNSLNGSQGGQIVGRLPVGVTVRIRGTRMRFRGGHAAAFGETNAKNGRLISGYMAATYLGDCRPE